VFRCSGVPVFLVLVHAEAEELRDPSELKKRIDDLDALSAIFSGGYDRGRRRGRHDRRHHRDEL